MKSYTYKKQQQRGLSILLSFAILTSLWVIPLDANIQIPVASVNVENVFYILGENVITGEPMITPTMTVGWRNPDVWAPAIDPADIHVPDFYDVEVKNVTLDKTSTIKVQRGSSSYNSRLVEVHEQANLETGSLYEIKVKPFHYHTVGDVIDLAPISGIAPRAFAITDPQVTFESDEDSITVVWDNIGIPEFRYRIVYALGDFSSRPKQELLDNKEGEINGLTLDSDKVTSFFDPISRRNKLSYTIQENIYPGQIYSVMVEPMVDNYSGVPVTRNRNYPVINNISTSIKLDYSEESDTLRLQWTIPASFKVGSSKNQYELVETRLVKYRDGQGQNIAILNGLAGAIGYYIVQKPLEETGYQLELTYKAVDDESKPSITPKSNLLTYAPTQVRVVPTKPVVPEFISEEILDELRATNSSEDVRDLLAQTYLVPGSTYAGNLNTLFDANITYHFDAEDKAINFPWSAFRRIDIDRTSPTYNQYITDLNTYYDIWVTDSYSSLSYATRFLSDQRFSSLDTNSLIKTDAGTIVGFHMRLDGFYNASNGKMETIRPNKIYYIKVQAKKKIGTETITSEPTVVTFYYSDSGASYVPPLITKPPLRIKDDATTSQSVTIAWKEKWWEVIDPNSTIGDPFNTWTNQVWIGSDNTISTTPIDGVAPYKIYESQNEIIRLQTKLNSMGTGITLISREIDLGKDPFGVSNIYYKFLRIPYTDVTKIINEKKVTDPDYSFINYFDDLVKADKDRTNPLSWKRINPTINPDDIKELVYKESGLLPNTSYLFIVYPYRLLYNNEELLAHFPTPIVVATEPEPIIINPDPIVPNMYVTDYTERSVSLSWIYNTDFEYEIRYNTEDDVTKALPVPFTLPINLNDPLYPKNGQYYEVIAKDLFPNTGYYFYIRAKQPQTNKISQWNNPVFATTRDLPTPLPPRGVGIPPDSRMKLYNFDAAVTEDSIAISWLLDTNDTASLNDQSTVKVHYSYIIEMANNARFIGPTYVVSGKDDSVVPANAKILEKNLVQFNNLISNRQYYFRMKTRVTVIGSGKDQYLVKESEFYTTPIRVITVASDKEYDSGRDPALEILPSENYEVTYNKDTQELVYRFRSNEIGADGKADNRVDQRLISDLIKRNQYTYTVDVSNYENKPIVKRKILIPYTILESFNSYKIELAVDANKLLLKIPYNALMSEALRQKNQYGVAPQVEIVIEDVTGFRDKLNMPTNALTSVSVPQALTVKVKSSKVSKNMVFSDVPMNIGLSTNNRYTIYGKAPVVYALDSKEDWSQVIGTYDQKAGAFMLSTKNIGAYGVFLMEGSSEIKSTNVRHWSEAYKNKVDSLYTVKGLTGFSPDSAIPENTYINIVHGIVSGDKVIDVLSFVGSEQLNALYYSGIKIDRTKDGKTIRREEAIAMMMRAFEIRENLTLAPDIGILKIVNADVKTDAAFKNLVAKAATIGLVSDLNRLRPDDNLTYAEMFALWAKAEGGF
jgi:hypothetical protein